MAEPFIPREPLQTELFSLITVLLARGGLWPDDRMRLLEIVDHFGGRWEHTVSRSGRQFVRVMERNDARRVQASFGGPTVLPERPVLRRIISPSQSIRRLPSAKELVRYGRQVLLVLKGLSEARELSEGLSTRASKFEAELDLAATVLALGGQVA